ncbi:MAG: hypothetical protein V4543_12060, partial [Bacteroidota bacterium]
MNGTAAAAIPANRPMLVCPAPLVTQSGPVSFCAGASVTLSGPAGGRVTVSTIAAHTEDGYEAYFNGPAGVFTDNDGTTYVTDSWSHRIRKITAQGLVTTIAGGYQGYQNGTGENAWFRIPTGILKDNAGNLVVSDSYNDVIRLISPGNAVTTIAGVYSTGGFADGMALGSRFNSPMGIAKDGAGNIYIADAQNYKIRKLSTDGLVSTFAGGYAGFLNGQGTGAKFNEPSGVAVDNAGNVYVADYGNHAIRKITPAGDVSTLAGSAAGKPGLADGMGTNASFNNPTAVAVDASGNVYVTDQGNHRIRKITPAGLVSTFAGSSDGSEDGPALEAGFSSPIGLCIDMYGNITVADASNELIRKITVEPVYTAYLWSNGSTSQNLRVTASGSYTLRTVSNGCTSEPSLPVVVTVSGISPPIPTITAGGATSFCFGKTVVLSSSAQAGNYWSNGDTTASISVRASGTYSVKTISNECTSDASNAVTVNVTQTAGPTISAAGPVNVCAGGTVTLRSSVTAGNLWSNGATSQSITVNASGKYYVATVSGGCTSRNSNTIKVKIATPYKPFVNVSGSTQLCAGSSVTLTAPSSDEAIVSTLAGSDSGDAVGQGAEAKFDRPVGIARYGGNFYVTDYYNNNVKKITPEGLVTSFYDIGDPWGIAFDTSGNMYISTSAGDCQILKVKDGRRKLLAGDELAFIDGIGPQASFFHPRGITLDDFGNVFVADWGNQCIRKVTSAGDATTFAGSWRDGWLDGEGIGAKFYFPTGIEAGPDGNLYVADRDNSRIRKITGNVVSTVAGNGSFGLADGQGQAAVLNGPSGLIFDPNGNMYVADFSCIRKITPGGKVTTVAGNNTPGFADGLGSAARFNLLEDLEIDEDGVLYAVDFRNRRIRKIIPGADIDAYIWSDGSRAQKLTTTQAGNYTVRVVVNGCTSLPSDPVTVTVNQVPAGPVITYNGPLTLCNNQTATLTSSAATGNLWSTGDTTQSITAEYYGYYSVRTIIGHCTSAVSNVITLNWDYANPPRIAASGSLDFCSNNRVVLTTDISSWAGQNLLWSNGQTGPSIIVNTPGTYSVVYITGNCTSDASVAVNVTVRPAPEQPVITASGPLEICYNEMLTLTSSSPVNNLWSTGETTQSITASTSGSYSVKTILGGCTSVSS